MIDGNVYRYVVTVKRGKRKDAQFSLFHATLGYRSHRNVHTEQVSYSVTR